MIRKFEDFLTAFHKINRLIQKIKVQEMSDFGLKGTHVMCLYFLQKYSEGLTSVEIARYCDEDKAAISRTLKELNQKGLIRYSDVPGQRRYRSIVTLTDDGNKVTTGMFEKITRIVEKATRGYTKSERAVFYRVLMKIAGNLEDVCSEGETL